MSLSMDLYGDNYFENLRNFRDNALIESRWKGRRKNIGRFTYGLTQAEWQSAEGGSAHLIERGMRYKSFSTRILPTTLRIFSPITDSGYELEHFLEEVINYGPLYEFLSVEV